MNILHKPDNKRKEGCSRRVSQHDTAGETY